MHRARLRSIAALAAVLLAPTGAWAWHAGTDFTKPPGAGGAGDIYYAGTQLEKGWDCTMCHTGAKGELGLSIHTGDMAHPDVLQLDGKGTYIPGATYALQVSFVQERLGIAQPLSNANSLVAVSVDARGFYTGKLSGGPLYNQPNDAVLLYTSDSDLKNKATTTWAFTWTAPVAGSGDVSLHLAAVDGDGAAGSASRVGTETLSDPLHDDVAVLAIRLREGSATASNGSVPSGTAVFAAGLVACALVQSGRRRRGG